MNYREDIDGLRSIAVLLVVLCHVGFYGFDGGYLGVDMFFVISGFLITSNIIYKLENNNFSFKKFYLNRIKRIAPVLVFILLFLTIFNLFVLFPNSLQNYFKFLPYALLGLGNYAASNLSTGYFDASSERYQLLHTWSLGVEEQFYLIVPVLLVLIWKIKSYFTKTILVILIYIVSIAVSIYCVACIDDFKSNYYLIHTRFFEIFTGTILAYFYSKIPNIKSKLVANVIHFLSVVVLIFLSYYYNENISWPGFNALIVSALTGMLIYLGNEDNPHTLTKKILSSNFMRFIGKISYSLYLWHWIIIATLVEIGFEVKEFNSLEKIALIILMLPISYWSWKYIENTFRYKYVFKLQWSFALWVLLPLSLSFGLLFSQKYYPSAFYSNKDIDLTTYKLNHLKTPHIAVRNNSTTEELSKLYKRSEYLIGDTKKGNDKKQHIDYKEADVLILANSHFHAFKKFVSDQLKDKGLVAHVLHESTTKVYTYKDAKEIYKELLKGKKYLIIWARTFEDKIGGDGIDWREWFVNTALEMNIQPVVYVPGLELFNEGQARKNLYYQKLFSKHFNEKINVYRALSYIPSLDFMQSFYDKYKSEVRWIDFKPLLCDELDCYLWNENTDEFLLFDKHHIIRDVGVELGEEYSLKYGNIFDKSWSQPPIMLKRHNNLNYSEN